VPGVVCTVVPQVVPGAAPEITIAGHGEAAPATVATLIPRFTSELRPEQARAEAYEPAASASARIWRAAASSEGATSTRTPSSCNCGSCPPASSADTAARKPLLRKQAGDQFRLRTAGNDGQGHSQAVHDLLLIIMAAHSGDRSYRTTLSPQAARAPVETHRTSVLTWSEEVFVSPGDAPHVPAGPVPMESQVGSHHRPASDCIGQTEPFDFLNLIGIKPQSAMSDDTAARGSRHNRAVLGSGSPSIETARPSHGGRAGASVNPRGAG